MNIKRKIGSFLSVLLAFLFIQSMMFSALAEPPEVKSGFAILIDADSGVVLYQKNALEKAYPASTTKIMTAILVCELTTDWDELVAVGREVRDFTPGVNSLMGIKENEKLTIRDLLYGMMVVSGNDAAATLAIHFGESIEGFAVMMNAKARELGMNDTNFVNPHGLHKEDHYTTAADMAKLTQYAMKNEIFRKVVGAGKYVAKPTNKRKTEKVMYNTNKFLTKKEDEQDYHWSAVTGVKTGSTNAAQGCLVTAASQDGKNLVCVVFHDESTKSLGRWTESRALLEYGFENLAVLKLSDLNFPTYPVQVAEASKNDPESGALTLETQIGDATISGLKSEIDLIKSSPSALELTPIIDQTLLVAPIIKGQVLGTVSIKHNGEIIATTDLIATRDISSVSSDPKSAVTSLIEKVVEPSGKLSPVFIAIVTVSILLVLCVLMLLLRRRWLQRVNIARRKKNSYYNYYK